MIPHNKLSLGAEEEQAATRVIHSGWLAQGEEVKLFENEFCRFLGLPDDHAVAVSSGTAALFLALWGLNARDKNVSFPVYACSALRNAVAMAGAKEHVHDINIDTPNIDIQSVNAADSSIVIVPHIFGIPANIENIKGKQVIEDCAQSLGASVNGIQTGLTGQCGVFSFYATKLISSGGQGGMIVAKDRSWIDEIRDYRQFDMRKDSKTRFNFQITDLQAAIGREQLKKLPGFISRREEVFNYYKNAGMELLDSSDVNRKPVRYRAVVKVAEPEKYIQALGSKKIKSIVPVEDWELLGDKQKFPNARKLAQNSLSLPVFPGLTEKEMLHIIASFRELSV